MTYMQRDSRDYLSWVASRRVTGMMIRVVVTTVRSFEAVYRDSRDLSRPPSNNIATAR
jgi:hypothetical protein